MNLPYAQIKDFQSQKPGTDFAIYLLHVPDTLKADCLLYRGMYLGETKKAEGER